jgi:hypothetical protein
MSDVVEAFKVMALALAAALTFTAGTVQRVGSACAQVSTAVAAGPVQLQNQIGPVKAAVIGGGLECPAG